MRPNKSRAISRAAAMSLTMALLAAPMAAQAAPMPCENGFAGAFLCQDVDFLSFMSISDLGGDETVGEMANLWGWTDPTTGKEYLIVGLDDQAAFVDVSDPVSPIYLGSLPSHTGVASKYRDIKVYQNHAFIISDLPSLHGMQVFDLTQLRDVASPPVAFTESAYFDGLPDAALGDAHNMYINEATGYAYLARTTTPEQCGGALYVVDLQDPLNPAFAGCVDEGGLASDSICIVYNGVDVDFQGREICAIASDDDIVVSDVTDKVNPVTLAVLDYPDITRAHNAWFTADHNFLVSVDMNDEIETGANTRLFAWDFRDVDNPQLIGIYSGPTAASDHNVWVRGTRAYIGNFRAGVRIIDISDIANGNLIEEAYFDMIPQDDNTGHTGGAWAVYPYLRSGTIAATDKTAGLYLLERSPRTVASIAFTYAMNDGSAGSGTYTISSNGSFSDGMDAGEWKLLAGPPRRLALQYAEGSQCDARSTGRFVAPGMLRGSRTCQDGSGVKGTWRGTIVGPVQTLSSP